MRISDWSSDVCSSDHPSSVLRQLGENLIDLDLADRRRGLVVCIDPPPLNRAARITGSVQPVMYPRIARGNNGTKYPVAVHNSLHVIQPALVVVLVRGLIKFVGQNKIGRAHV